MSEILRGNRLTGSTRAPKTHGSDRVCVHEGCGTRLSQYNTKDHCYAHAPTHFPRLRGRVVADS